MCQLKTIKSEIQRVIVLKQNAVDDTYLIEDIGANLSKPERLTAFALSNRGLCFQF